MDASSILYDDDFYLWTQQQAAFLQAGKLDELDVPHLAEEIAGLGQQDRRELRQRLEALLVQLLTWWAQPEEHCARWRSAIAMQRDALTLLLQDSPSLQTQLGAFLHTAYPQVRVQVMEDLRLLTLPEACPWSTAQVVDAHFYPEQATL